MKSVNTLTAKEKFLVVRTIRKKQFCKWEEKPNPNYKPELNDTRVPVFDTKQVPKLRNTLVCKGKMVDGTDVCKFPERFLRSVSVIPPKKPPPSNACKVCATICIQWMTLSLMNLYHIFYAGQSYQSTENRV